MSRKGDIVLAKFPFTNHEESKLRPVLILSKSPGEFDDYIVAFISSQIRHYVPEVDFLLEVSSGYFKDTGLKITSVIKTGKIATISVDVIAGKIGSLNKELTERVIDKIITILRNF